MKGDGERSPTAEGVCGAEWAGLEACDSDSLSERCILRWLSDGSSSWKDGWSNRAGVKTQ